MIQSFFRRFLCCTIFSSSVAFSVSPNNFSCQSVGTNKLDIKLSGLACFAPNGNHGWKWIRLRGEVVVKDPVTSRVIFAQRMENIENMRADGRSWAAGFFQANYLKEKVFFDIGEGDRPSWLNFYPDRSSSSGSEMLLAECQHSPALLMGEGECRLKNMFWDDETAGGCDEPAKSCLYRDYVQSLLVTIARNEVKALGWKEAQEACKNLEFGGLSEGWRLPTDTEVRIFLDEGLYRSGLVQHRLWTASVDPENPRTAIVYSSDTIYNLPIDSKVRFVCVHP